jgi:hypothetical protein
MGLGEIGGAIEIGGLLNKVRKFIKSKHAPRHADVSQPIDRKVFLQEFVNKCNSYSKYKLARDCMLIKIKDFHYFGSTLLSNLWIQQHQLDELIVRRHLSSFPKKASVEIKKNLQDVYVQELGHTPYETIITFSFSSIWEQPCYVLYENNKTVDRFKSHQYHGYYRYFDLHSQEFHNTGAKYHLHNEEAFFCGSCSNPVPIPIFCITSTERIFRSFGSKTEHFSDLFDRLMLSPLTERNWVVMIIEWIADLVAGSYRALRIIPRR